jgi:hypothetical protein
MKMETLLHYLSNCIWLLLPIMLWNIVFTDKLPTAFSTEFFWKDIPPFLATGENFFRLLVFVFPLLMPLRITTNTQKLGLALYLAGTLIYFLSWIALMYFPQSVWSMSAFGFLAPAYTPLIWLAGIGLIGSSLYFDSPYHSWMYIAGSVTFIAFHLSHTLTVYLRTL